ncbi:chemotaxis protein CheA [Desulfospira joergensenii]|uniref:chemotaxis protein CheA n=1 Tax=Desulfospira joergensenii TaxID=53329 RepID=UPI0003B5E61E|nr:chemotaxis protein CheA [Desulfospira joergensenii]
MASESIAHLIDKLSCDLVLADPEEPKTLSGLLPQLKRIHSEYAKQDKASEARTIVKIRNRITALLNDPGDLEREMEAIERLVSELSRPGDQTTSQGAEPAGSPYGQLEDCLDHMTLHMGSLGPDLPQATGEILKDLEQVIRLSKEIDPPTFHQVAIACKTYAGNMGPEDMVHTRPLEDGLILLKSLLTHLKQKEPFAFDYADVLELLNQRFDQEPREDEPGPEESKRETDSSGDRSGESPERISEEDMEVLMDFVSEAEESLSSIEVSLVELEQDPTSKDIINDIFRPFHTIKGVSGFLSLNKINRLAHATENLLDSARSGEFIINRAAIDAILESVDTLKLLIDRVNQGIQSGFMEPDHDISVEGPRERLQQLQTSLAGERKPIGEILLEQKKLDRDSLDRALEKQKTCPDKKIGEILVEDKSLPPEEVASALLRQNQAVKRVDAQVKVDTRKLDDLVDYAGELVIAQSMLRQQTSGDPDLGQNVAQLGLIVSKMQNIAMSMRMIPIKATFMKMIRLVRDLSRKSGKEVNLVMSGEETEIDRNVVDALYEPMVHMIRNSVDHGIEPQTGRLDQGKPSQGNIWLRAFHKGGSIVIEIEDDGKGLDRGRILEKAKSTGLVQGGEQMTDTQVYDLIMEPGFSTAKEITDVSGRGVGMDVVKDGIEKFRGHLTIESEKGRGTKFTISLPLTLAIIDGMLVRVEDKKYVIPTTAVQKAFKPGADEYFTVEGKGEMVKNQGRLIPLIRLNGIFNNCHGGGSVRDGLVVVVESKDENRAILIDELLGKDEYVIKSLGTGLGDVKGIAGGAVLADGRVGLILDIHGIFSIAENG